MYMIKNPKTTFMVIGLLLTSCTLMYFTEIHIRPTYLVKSIFKIILFGLIPFLYSLFDKSIELRNIFKAKSKKQLVFSFFLALCVYLLIIIGFLLLKTFIQLNTISAALSESLKIDKNNFIYIAIYISFINSLLEEFFFRGFIFFSLKNISSNTLAYILSALSFSLYHIAIISSWFNIYLFLLIILGLFISGLFFNWLNRKTNNIYNSWLIHMFANFSINTIGIFMFYFN